MGLPLPLFLSFPPSFFSIQHLFKSQPNYKKSFRARECFGGKCGKGNNLTICWRKRQMEKEGSEVGGYQRLGVARVTCGKFQESLLLPHANAMATKMRHLLATTLYHCQSRRERPKEMANSDDDGQQRWPCDVTTPEDQKPAR